MASTETKTESRGETPFGDTDSTTQGPKSEQEQTGELAPVQSNAPANGFLGGFKLFILMSGLTVVMFLAMLDMAIIGTAIPQISSDFHRLQDVGWYIGAYQLASAALQPLTGKVYTYFSTKWSLLFFFFIFEVGSALCGAAQSSTMFIIGRAVAGMGGAGLSNGSLTILTGAVSPDKRPFYTSLIMAVGQIGILLGPILGGVFTERATWRWCFYVNLPLGALVAAFLLSLRIPDHIVKKPVSLQFLRELLPLFDLTGFALFAPAAIMLLLALQFGSGDYSWSSPTVIGCFCGAGATAIVFLLWERRMGKNAMMPLELISRRVMWTSSVFFGVLMSVTVGGSNYLPIFFQSVKGKEPLISAVYLLPGIGSQIFFILLSGALMTKLGFYIPWAAFSAAGTAIGCGLISTWKPDASYGQMFGYQILYAARGAGIQVGFIAVQNLLPPKELAVGMSFLVFCQNIFAAVIVTVANTIFQEELRGNIRKLAPSIPPEAAIAAGGSAQAVRSLARGDEELLQQILRAFSDSFDGLMYLFVACSVLSFFVCFGMGWVDLRKLHKKADKTATSDDEKEKEKEKTKEEV